MNNKDQTVRIIDTDVCIVGSGASGSIVSAKLAGSGLRVDVVEQGRSLPDHANFDDVISASEPAMARLDNGAWGPIGYPWTSCNVGGGTAFYGAASYRLRAVDFAPDTHLPGAELSGRWPISYERLAPYYDEIEEILGLSGDPIARDPTHPGGREPPMPPIPPSPQARHLFEAGRHLGLSPFATPLLICSTPYRGRPPCGFCSPCIEHKCSSKARGDPYSVLLEPLLSGADTVLHQGVKAIRLISEQRGRAAALEAVDVDTGERRHWRARVFVLGANAIQSAAILLRSAESLAMSEPNPASNPLARGLCMKLNAYVVGTPDRRFPRLAADDPWSTGVGPFSTVACTDYYLAEDCPTGMGGLIYEARYGWRYGSEPANDVARLECLIADTPSLQNRVRLAHATDRFSIPLVAIDYRPHPRDVSRLNWLVARAAEWLAAAGFSRVWQEPGGYSLGSCHLHGTCRAGHDQKTSVVDPEGRLHGFENIFVTDGAYMPFPGAVNPTLSIQAVASMVCDAVCHSLGLRPRTLGFPPAASPVLGKT